MKSQCIKCNAFYYNPAVYGLKECPSCHAKDVIWRRLILRQELHEFWPELKRSIVKTRKPHECNYCGHDMPKGTLMRVDTGKVPEDGMISLYVCIPCVEEVMCGE